MAAIKDKLSRIRKGPAEPAPSPATLFPEKVEPPPAAAGPSRFGGLKNVQVGDFSEVGSQHEPLAGSLDEDIPFDALPATRPTPAATDSPRSGGRFAAVAQQQARPRGERQVANPSVQAHVPGARAPAASLPQIQWDDPARPAGSSYSEQEWLDAEEGGANVVFEMVKPDEIGLCAVPRAGMNAVLAALYERSLVVSEDVPSVSQWPVHARVVHRDPVLGPREVLRYRVVRAAAEIKKTPWLQGSVLNNDLEVAFQESKAQQAEKARFGNMPRQR